MNSNLSLIVTLVALFANVFLFLTVLGTKKNKQIVSFLLLLASFVLWCGGSLLMRLGVYPGARIWFAVSSFGLFAVPFCIYNFMYYYTNRKGKFALFVWLVIWAAILVLNVLDVFLIPTITKVGGSYVVSYAYSLLALIPAVAAILTLAGAVRMIYRNIREDGIPANDFLPFLLGIAVMVVGMLLQTLLPSFGLNTDTVYCGINAICIYYALCKKRLLTLTPLSSKGPVALLAICFTTLLFYVSFDKISALLNAIVSSSEESRMIFFALFFSVVVVALFFLLQLLMSKLFVKGHETREQEIKAFSNEVSRTLERDEIVNTFKHFIQDNLRVEKGYIFLWNEDKDAYTVSACTDDVQLTNQVLQKDNPLLTWLAANNKSIRYQDFCRTRMYRSMWESEKDLLSRMDVELALPIVNDERLIGFTLFMGRKKQRSFTFSEINFMESAAAVLAIAFQNAELYATMQREARLDALTGLFNRGYFHRKLEEEFALCARAECSLLMLSFDDFRLFNELYGSVEGDRILKEFAEILQTIVAGRGFIARYGGKEFMVFLPYTDPRTAENIAEQCRSQLNNLLAHESGMERKFITFSAGVCGYPSAAGTVDELLTFTNMAIYSAKKNGKNRTVVYAQEDAEHPNEVTSLAKREFADISSQTIFALTAAIDAKDHYTFNHSNTVSDYAAQLAQAIGLDKEHVEIIRQAGFLHDVGKIGIPESILCKPGRLTDDEFEIMKQHVMRSIAIIRYLPSLDYVIPAAIGHHERWDGRGYPRGLAGETIPIGARCLCIADSFDAMISQRPYKAPMSVEAALAEIERCLGTQFDPVLGRKFIELVRDGVIKAEQNIPPQEDK